jgi:MFS family permease
MSGRVYQIENSRQVLERGGSLRPRGFDAYRIGRNVFLLGLVSFFTDISAEMVATILPIYLIYSIGLSPLQFGVVDGIYQGAAAVARLAGGFFADRTRRHKEVATVGYALSAATKLALLAAGTWGSISTVVGVDRVGKGIRTAPRDALISLSTRADSLGQAFGVHRALDTAGAMLGPLVAFGILALAQNPYDAVFVVSFLAAVVGLAIMVLFVQNRPVAQPRAPRLTVRSAAAMLRHPRLRALVVVGTVLSLMTISDGFVYLSLQQRGVIPLSVFPLLYVGTALAYMTLAVPVGRLADIVGRARVFLGGYVLLLGAYAMLIAGAPDVATVTLVLLLFGAYYAATDGVLPAMASSVVPAEARATGLAVVATGVGTARLVASLAVGAMWTVVGIETTLVVFTALLAAGIVLASVVLIRTQAGPGA